MRKYLRFVFMALAICIGLAGTGLLLETLSASPQEVVRPLAPYYAHLDVTDVDASTWYVLVDLSDSTNFPHYGTNNIVLKQLCYTGVLSEAGHFDARFGVVSSVGITESDVEFFHTKHMIEAVQFDEKWTLPEHGLNLYVSSDDTIYFVASREITTTGGITTTLALESPVTESDVVTTYAGIGDIVMYLEEVDVADNAIDISVGVAYDTE